ncbi:MAG: YeeE/YedE family protein [Firmicutes bacterium HGW-Firmicutes-14]|jgi:hypothetical protein|nr:MAG: YeeE/YedE family protein [Firmicutes bacterium HGW-Firmicutes-14]
MIGKKEFFYWLIKGNWPQWFGGILLAFLNIILTIFYKTWGITGDTADWGFRVWSFLGGHPERWTAYFNEVGYKSLYKHPIYNGDTVLNFGLVIGVFLAVTLAGEFRIKKIKSARQVILGLIGGILMGYGARLALGCNVGAMIGGISSQSPHGWIFAVFMIFGSLAGSLIIKKFFIQ